MVGQDISFLQGAFVKHAASADHEAVVRELASFENPTTKEFVKNIVFKLLTDQRDDLREGHILASFALGASGEVFAAMRSAKFLKDFDWNTMNSLCRGSQKKYRSGKPQMYFWGAIATKYLPRLQLKTARLIFKNSELLGDHSTIDALCGLEASSQSARIEQI